MATDEEHRDRLIRGLFEALWNRKVVAVLGAGASVTGEPPLEKKWTLEHPSLPTGGQLAAFFGTGMVDPPPDLSLTASLAERKSRGVIDSFSARVRSISEQDPPPPLYPALYRSELIPHLTISTNYDGFVERACGSSTKLLTITYREPDKSGDDVFVIGGAPMTPGGVDLKLHDHWGRDGNVLFKVHGSYHKPVLRDEDYLKLYRNMMGRYFLPKALWRWLYGKDLVVIGSSLRDWSVRLLLDILGSPRRLSEPEAVKWLVAPGLGGSDLDLAEQRGFRVIDTKADELAEKLNTLLDKKLSQGASEARHG